jgi:CBS domain-containing protein
MTLQTIQVRDYMSRALVVLNSGMEILQALDTFVRKDISAAPVVDESGALIGILTEKDCMKVALNAAYHSEYGGIVADYMTASVISVHPDDGIVALAERFLSERYHRYPVVENGRLVGVISRRDIVRALGEAWQ